MLEIFFAGMTSFLHAAAMVTGQGLRAADVPPYARTMLAILPATLEGLIGDVDRGSYPGTKDRITAMKAPRESGNQGFRRR